jgi:hypothetical protein
MVGTCKVDGGVEEKHITSGKDTNHLGGQVVDGRMILKLAVKILIALGYRPKGSLI